MSDSTPNVGIGRYFGATPPSGTMVNVDTLLTRVVPYLKGAPARALLLDALRDSARRFCIESGAWMEVLPEITVIASQTTVTLEHSYSARIGRVVEVKQDARDLPDHKYLLDMQDRLVLATAPTAAAALLVTVVFEPLEACAEYPQWFFERWGEAFWRGALGNLKLQDTQRPWFDQGGGSENLRRFYEIVGEAKRMALTGRTRGDLRVVPMDFV